MDQNPSLSSNHLESGATTEPSSAKVVIGEVAQGARQVAADLASRARKAAENQLSEVQQLAADRLGSVADALRASGNSLRAQDGELVSGYVDRAVDKLDAASGYLQRSSFASVISDLEAFARREPAIVFGGAFFLGLLGGRFFKSSSGALSGGRLPGGSGGGELPKSASRSSTGTHMPTGKSQSPDGNYKGVSRARGGGSQSGNDIESERATPKRDFSSDRSFDDPREPVHPFEDQSDDDPSNSGAF